MRFQGKVVLVTGAASGIGRAATLQFAREGATVLAKSEQDDCHAFRWRDRAWGVQFHPEFATHHIRGYVAFRGDELRQAGRCPATIARDVTAAPQARKLLRRFVKHARGLHAR